MRQFWKRLDARAANTRRLIEHRSRSLNLTPPSQSEFTAMAAVSTLVGLAPSRVFVTVVGDAIQLSALLVPITITLLVLLATVEFSISGDTPPDVMMRLTEKRVLLTRGSAAIFVHCYIFVVVALAAKFVCVWFDHRGWLAWIIDHIAAWIAAMLGVGIIIAAQDLLKNFGYLIELKNISILAKHLQGDVKTI